MNGTKPHLLRQSLAVAVAVVVLAGCAEEAPLTPAHQPQSSAQFAKHPGAEQAKVIATLRHATARYHNIDAAIADGFVLVHPCEEREGEGVGALYANFGRVGDGIIDPESPEGLVYEPGANGRLRLVAVELFVPYTTPMRQPPPQFLGATFGPEDEFGGYGLHVWVWRHNPNGMFALTNPKVSCDAA